LVSVRNQRNGGITYYGGKAQLAEQIINLMPPHRTYCEPFAGGLSVLFRKAPSRVEVINDIDERIVKIYRVMREDATARELVSRLFFTPFARKEHLRARHALRDPEASEVEKAWACLIELGQSINSRIGSGWHSSDSGNTQHASAWRAQIERIIVGVERLRHVEIECKPAVEVIERYDSRQTLHYCDPPYPGSDQGHYRGFRQEHFNELWAALSAAKGHAMVSCYPGAVTDEMAIGWELATKPVKINANRHQVQSSDRTEQLWIRSATGTQRSLFQLAALEGSE
jgi:DNA adenine methylase